jgi:hypothetical protein
MNSIRIQCEGCKSYFTPRGLSQHISKTQKRSCRADYTTLQTPSAAANSDTPVSAPLDSMTHTPCVSGAVPCDNPDESSSIAADGALNPIDPADVMDADAFEALSRGDTSPMATNPDQQASLEDPDQQSIEINSDNSDAPTASTVTIEQFSFGSPGAPIPGMPPGPSTYESQVTLAASVWAPFRSQCDWDLARWAKMRSPTSSAVTDLLAIPTVWSLYHAFITASNSPAFRL